MAAWAVTSRGSRSEQVDRQLLRLTRCSSCPSVHRPRNQEHAHAHRTESQCPRKIGRRIACTPVTMCQTRYAMVPAIGVLLSPAPPRGPGRSLWVGPVGVRAGRHSLPPRVCAAQPRRFPGSNKQVRVVVRPRTLPSQPASPSAPSTVGVGVGRNNRGAVGDRRNHPKILELRIREVKVNCDDRSLAGYPHAAATCALRRHPACTIPMLLATSIVPATIAVRILTGVPSALGPQPPGRTSTSGRRRRDAQACDKPARADSAARDNRGSARSPARASAR